MFALRYGTADSVNLPLDRDALEAVCDAPRGRPLVDVGQTLTAALAEPLDFPPLMQAALPGDKVVLALDVDLPQSGAIVAATVAALVDAGVSAADITLLVAPVDAAAPADDPRAALGDELRQAVGLRVHDPHDRQALAFLGPAGDARPIYLNRALTEADLVLPIGVLRVADSLGYYGVNSVLFPTFADEECRQRFRGPKAAEPARQDRLRKQADEVAWLLGVQFTIQVVPGGGGDVLHVLAGEVESVFRKGSRLCDEAWSFIVPDRAGLVVATMEGAASQQTWQNVGRALAAAAHATDEEGAVLVCSQLAEPLGPGLQRLAGAEDASAAMQEIGRERPIDALCAAQLVQARERGPVYLVSQLDDETVEELGLSPLDARSIARVMGRYSKCIVLANAPLARVATPREAGLELPLKGRKSRS